MVRRFYIWSVWVRERYYRFNEMKRIILLIALIGIIGISYAKEYHPLELEWKYPIRADDVAVLDIDKDGFKEVYVSSYSKRDSCIYILDEIGNLERRNCIPRYSNPLYPHAEEEITLIYVDDLENDGILDVIAASKIIGTAVNVNKIYGIRREYEPGIGYRYRRKWDFTTGSTVTSIYSEDVDNDGTKEIIASSIDFNVYVLNKWGGLEKKYSLKSGVWDVHSARFFNISNPVIVAGSLDGVSLIEYNDIKWTYPTNSRVFDVFASDLGFVGEILALTDSDYVYLINSKGMRRWNKRISNLVDSLTGDLNNDGTIEIIIATNNKLLFLNDEGDIELEYGIDDKIIKIRIYDGKLYVCCENGLYVFKSNTDYFINKNAERLYEIAYQYYIQGIYDNARRYAEIAKKFFSEIGNEDGIKRCEFIISSSTTVTTIANREDIADSYLEKAKEYFSNDNYKDAEFYANMALDIYVEVGSEKAIECHKFLIKVREKIREENRKVANQYYEMAVEFLNANEFENATIYVKRAKDIYSNINDTFGIQECNSLMSEIIRKSSLSQADEFYSMAEEYYDLGMYENASTYAEIAREIYDKVNYSSAVKKCEFIIDMSNKHISAAQYLRIANEFFERGEYENATEYAKKAKDIYSELKDFDKVAECDSLISSIESRKIGSLILNAAIVFFIVSVAVVLFIVFWKGGKYKKPKKAEKSGMEVENTKLKSQDNAELK